MEPDRSSAPSPASLTGAWADQHRLAAELDTAGPGVALVTRLSALEPADLDDAALVEAVAAWERVSSWAAAHQASMIAEMTRRASSSMVELVPDDVAARLAVSRRSAQYTCDIAVALDSAPAIHDALSTGAVDLRKAAALLRETEHLPASQRDAVRAEVLADAPDLTVPQLRVAIRRAELRLDPAAAEVRHERARRQRCVRITPALDSMAWVSALLPAHDAVSVMIAVDSLAGAVAAPGDDRSIDERRADALVGVMRTVLDTGSGPPGRVGTRQRRHPHLHVTANPSTLSGAGDAPGELAGFGPIPASVVREVASQAAWRAVGVDPQTGELVARSSRSYRPGNEVAGLVVDRDVTCTFPGCRVPAVRCDLDHIKAFDAELPAEQQTTVENLQALCRHHHRLKTLGRWVPSRDPASGVTAWRSRTGHVYRRDPIGADPGVEPPRRTVRPTVPADAHLVMRKRVPPGAHEASARENGDETPPS